MIDKNLIISMSKNNNKYKSYYIGNNGRQRLIQHPSKEIKLLQYWLVNNLLNKLPCSKYATGYEPGCSIIRNAAIHADNKYILHTDIKDFFNSITVNMVESILSKSNLNLIQEDINFIIDVVFYKSKIFPTGSVSSPCLSNRVMYNFDLELKSELDTFYGLQEFKFTRYADDIIISSNYKIQTNIVDIIKNLLNKYGFEINKNKTYFMYTGRQRKVTGIVIDNATNKLSVGTHRIRALKRNLYNYLIKAEKNEKNEEIIRGELAFIKSVSESQYSNLKNIYSKYQNQHKIIFDINK